MSEYTLALTFLDFVVFETVNISHLSVTVINAMTKATSRRKGLFWG